jgi:HEAT repeat protein
MLFLQRLFGPPTVESLEASQDVEGLLAALDRHMSACRAVVEALGRIGDERAVDALVAILNGDDMRKSAARALGRIGDARAVEPLVDEFDDVPQVAAGALAGVGAPAVEPLIAALRRADLKVRWAAAEALGQIGAPAVEPLIELLEAQDKRVHRAAAWALGQTGDPRAVEPLIAALEHGDGDVRRIAAQELGRMGAERAVGSLIAALQDEDQELRDVVVDALTSITGEEFDEDIAGWQGWWDGQ